MNGNNTMSETKTIEQILAAVQSQWSDPKRTNVGQVGHSRYRYAGLESVLALVREHLAPHGVSLVQCPTTARHPEGNCYFVQVETVLTGPAGDTIKGTTSIPLPGNSPTPQQAGSAITYARRYSLLALLGLGQDDDDGAGASAPSRNGGRPTRQPAAKPTPPKQQATGTGNPPPQTQPTAGTPTPEGVLVKQNGTWHVSAPTGMGAGESLAVRNKDGGTTTVVLTERVGELTPEREAWTWTKTTE